MKIQIKNSTAEAVLFDLRITYASSAKYLMVRTIWLV